MFYDQRVFNSVNIETDIINRSTMNYLYERQIRSTFEVDHGLHIKNSMTIFKFEKLTIMNICRLKYISP